MLIQATRKEQTENKDKKKHYSEPLEKILLDNIEKHYCNDYLVIKKRKRFKKKMFSLITKLVSL